MNRAGSREHDGEREGGRTPLPVGSYAVDTRTGQLGRVMGHEGPYVQLRPPGGGREWDCRPEAVRSATSAERERAGAHRTLR